MDSAYFQKIKEVFAEALEKSAKEREDFLREKCADDAELLAEVKSLLDANDKTEKFIEQNALDIQSEFVAGKHYDGTQFGNYKIIGEIGRGGMGAVFLAERSDGEFEQKVALKIIRQSFAGGDLEKHFRRERQILASLNHPNIAKLLDGGVSASGELFLAMEYIEGELLLSYAEHHNLEIKERLNLFLKICCAVSFAHQNLIVHRDIKPANILVGADGEPKLLDFGLARVLSENFASDPARTETVFRAFTPSYASPEQIRGKNVSTISDVYSLGVVFYELLTGDKPFHFEGKSIEEIMKTATENEPSFPSRSVSSESPQSAARISQLKGDLDNIALTALRKEPERRYKSVEAFAGDIERHLQGLPVSARPNTISYRAAKFFGRNKIAIGATAFIITSLISGLAIALWQASVARAQRDRAESRFNDVRQLSNALLNDIAPKIERLEGSTEARQAVVAQSLKYLDSLAGESADDLTLQAELAAAYEKIGVLQGDSRKPSLSDFRGAIASLEKAQAVRRRLLEINQNDVENRRLLAENLRLFALRRMTQSDVEGGFRDSKEALQIYENLIAENPDSLELQRAFLETQIENGTSYTNLNRYAEAIPLLQHAAGTIEALRRTNSADTETERILAKCLASLGVALSWESRQPEAEAEMTRALTIAESLAARFPNDTNLKQELWKIYESAGGIYEEIDDARAFELCEKSRRLAEEIIAADRANAQARHNLSKSFSRLGISASNLGKHAEALDYLDRAMAIVLELQEKDPLNRGYDRDVSALYIRIGVARYKRRDFTGAVAAHQKGAELFEKQLAADAANTIALRDSAIAYRHAGISYKELAKTADPQARQIHLAAEKENYQRALNALLNAQAQKALPESSRELIEKFRKDIEELENIR
ncbi:MAG: serine/threonine protein kinase [Acidobacteriota bacterium]|nr:serine/threonine protein kinase [Acidobacteriota bacterium]